MRPRQPIRWCAVYTRKSSEEGLEQDFNSLDAQREAGKAYVESQRHEGWRPLTTQYDDGGYSGGTLERPALQRLLADIRAGKSGNAAQAYAASLRRDPEARARIADFVAKGRRS